MNPRLARRLKWLLFFRLAVIVFCMAAILGLEGGFLSIPGPTNVPPLWTLLAAVIATLFYLFWARSGRAQRLLIFVQIFGDILLVGLLVYFTGFDRLFALLYFAVIIAAGTLLGTRWALGCASVSTVLVSAISVLYFLAFTNALDSPILLPGVHESIGTSYTSSPSALPYLFFFALSLHVVALLAGRLAEEASRVRILNDEILQNMVGGVIAVDRDGKLAFVNAQASQLLGVNSQKAVGRSYRDALPDTLSALIRQSLQGGTRIHKEMSNGNGTPLDITISTLRDERGRQIRGVVAIVNDLTDRRRLVEAQQRAERFQALLEMSAAMAHEVRNPLASIRGAAQELAGESLEREEDQQLMQIVMRESDRLNRIISDFLEYAGDKPMEPAICDLTSILQDIVGLVEARDDTRDLRITAHYSGESLVRADENKLKQVFLNLLLNAADACGEDGEVTVVCEPKRNVEGTLSGFQVEVIDSGPGVPAGDLARVFDPFFTTKPHGTGMGLATARKVIQGHEGTIELDSEEGKGTTCRVWLPA